MQPGRDSGKTQPHDPIPLMKIGFGMGRVLIYKIYNPYPNLSYEDRLTKFRTDADPYSLMSFFKNIID